MNWLQTNWGRKSAEIAVALESQPPRSTLLPPAPRGVRCEAPPTMRVPIAPAPRDLALDFIDAALAHDMPDEIEVDYDDFFDDESPTSRRSGVIAPSTPTMPSRID